MPQVRSRDSNRVSLSRFGDKALAHNALILVAASAISLLMWTVLDRFESKAPRGHHYGIGQITPDRGRAYLGVMGDSSLATPRGRLATSIFMVALRRGGPLPFVEHTLGGSYACGWIAAVLELWFPSSTRETWIRLGPQDSTLDDIRQKGDGRYMVTPDRLYFSLPDGTEMVEVQRLEAVVAPDRRSVSDRVGDVMPIALSLAAATLAIQMVLVGYGSYRTSAFARDLFQMMTVTGVILLGVLASAEVYLRAANKFPKSQIAVPRRFVPGVGFQYEPRAQLRWTNGLDFWSVQRTNSLGFADREPTVPKPVGTFRILLVGDSFVEALQVPLQQKLQSLLGERLRQAFPRRNFDVVAMGYQGTGQANQLPFVEKYNASLTADLVVLLFVNNDFANNSSLLESVRRGCAPDDQPLLFFKIDANGQCHRNEISSEFREREIPGATEAGRMKILEGLSADYQRKLSDWDPQKDPIDSVFFKEGKLPPAFEEAIELTKCTFVAWKTLAEKDHFRLVLMATDNLTKGAWMKNEEYGQIDRLKSISRELSLPLLDLYPIFSRKGGVALARWKHDGHWNPTGHRWAAEALIDFLTRGGYLEPEARTH